MIDLLYVSFNRLRFTVESFGALMENTSWGEVEKLYVVDDGSTDSTADFLRGAIEVVPTEVEFMSDRFGGPVAAMNLYLERGKSDVFAKIDNDFIVPPDWLDEMLNVWETADLDVLGTEPFIGLDEEAERSYEPCEWIGGKGLIRKSIFDGPIPADGRFGWTHYQASHSFRKAWVKPDLRAFGIDQLPFEPWESLAAEYEEKGWQRRWPAYNPASEPYWSWWTPVDGS